MNHDATSSARVVCDGLLFPEGPIAMADGSVLVVEIRRATLTKITADGSAEVAAEWGDPAAAGPNGAAVGPDGSVYVCNNGGFNWHEVNGMWLPQDPATGATQSPAYRSGSIDKVDLATGVISTLYTECDGRGLRGPNDLVFDGFGGFWFTDLGKSRSGEHDSGALFYAAADGSSIERVVPDLITANGVGLAPDGSTVYVSETRTGRLWAFDLSGPGQLAPGTEYRYIDHHFGRCVVNTLGYFDSLAVTADGDIVVAALHQGLCVVSPDGSGHHYVSIDDPLATNVAFGGAEGRTAYVTGSGIGQLIELEWPVAGTPLNR